MTEKMTAVQAQSFDRKSEAHEIVLAQVAQEHGCTCMAYQDFYTYRRWQAQNMQVQKGEKGTRLTTYIPITKTDATTGESKVTGTRPKGYSVFCRCQVKPK